MKEAASKATGRECSSSGIEEGGVCSEMLTQLTVLWKVNSAVFPRMYRVGDEHELCGSVPPGLDGGCKMREPYIPSWAVRRDRRELTLGIRAL